MKNKKVTVIILAVTLVLSLFSFNLLNRTPLAFFVLKNEVNTVRVYKVQVFLSRQIPIVESIALSPRQVQEADKIITDENLNELKTWSKSLGAFDFVLGFLKCDNDWVSCWNNYFSSGDSNRLLSNLSPLDRIYLSLMAHPTLSASPLENATVPPSVTSTPVSVPATPISSKTAVVETGIRVEVLNGCGIKGAAVWVVSRIKGKTITAVNGGNADHFTYAHSRLLSATAISPVLQSVLERAGFSHLGMTLSSSIPNGYDVVLIVGKDFRKIKGK
jgi:hypothetical protein